MRNPSYPFHLKRIRSKSISTNIPVHGFVLFLCPLPYLRKLGGASCCRGSGDCALCLRCENWHMATTRSCSRKRKRGTDSWGGGTIGEKYIYHELIITGYLCLVCGS